MSYTVQETKHWRLYGEINSFDYRYLCGCAVKVTVGQRDTVELDTPRGVVRYTGHLNTTEVVTETPEQETALRLKFADRLQLVEVTYMQSTCVLSTMQLT